MDRCTGIISPSTSFLPELKSKPIRLAVISNVEGDLRALGCASVLVDDVAVTMKADIECDAAGKAVGGFEDDFHTATCNCPTCGGTSFV